MRVLLLGLSLRPESGGGYTFSQDVFRALMRAEGHKHQFFVVDSPQLPSALPKTFSRIPVSQRAFRHGLAWLLAMAKRYARRYLGLGGGGYTALSLPGQNAQLRKYELDCAFSLNPGEWSPILPNICTVLDLEHRRKPYFPELGERSRVESPRTLLPSRSAQSSDRHRWNKDRKGSDRAPLRCRPSRCARHTVSNSLLCPR